MKTAEAGFSFPVLAFTPDFEIWGFADFASLTSCGPRTLKENAQAGMELVDADGRRWIVRSVRKIGRAYPLLPWLLRALITTPQFKIEHELDPLESITLDEVRRRARKAMKTFSECYVDHDEDQVEFEQLLVKVDQARKISEIYDLLQPDTFQPV